MTTAVDRERDHTSCAESGAGDTEVAPAPVGLLVLLEPGDGCDGLSGLALAAEGQRLARTLGVPIHLATWPEGAGSNLEGLTAAAVDLILKTRPAAVIMADTDTGRQLAPMIAYRLGYGCVTGCSDVFVRAGALVFVKPVYGGWLEQDFEVLPGTVPVATLDLAGMEASDEKADRLPTPETLQVDVSLTGPVRRLELISPDPRSMDLVHAGRIIAAGAGSVGEDLLAVVQELSELLEGSVGTTRPVVDDGRLPKERLIGQTGRTVTPELYLALGLSGSPHHVAGVRGAGQILAVNKDVRAPIFQFADLGYVADLRAVLPALVSKIKEWRDAFESPNVS